MINFGVIYKIIDYMLKIYHNPRCSKSRQTLQLIEAAGAPVEIITYLSDILTVEELTEIVKKLGIAPESLVRKGEAIYKENFKGKTFSDQEWLRILHENPKLIERPIVTKGSNAIIGRPPENVNQLL